ncbi:MAG TPA: RNA pseudouridine synthase [Luteimonas sp.]|nr:RNA pseudouridine synthase [Luteimonas sp.]
MDPLPSDERPDTAAPDGARRLDRCVADMKGCSRGDAQRYIAGGWVRIDGQVVDAPQAVVGATQRISLSPYARLDPIEPATLLLHKPAGMAPRDVIALATPAARHAEDASGLRTLERHFNGLSPAMPLEASASGLLVLSQDGRIHRRLTDDRATIEQEFVVQVSEAPSTDVLPRLAGLQRVDSRRIGAFKVSWQNEVRLRFAIRDVQPGQLQAMCADAGLRAVAIRRIRIGRIPLAKLPPGTWRYLPTGARF